MAAHPAAIRARTLLPVPVNREGNLTYQGVNSYSRKWQRLKTYGGKLVENITQAAARDVLAGNMPLIEPLESKEVKKIEEFVIVIDTSMSCSGELVRKFLEETYGVLSESESFFTKINVHIIQCDEKVHTDKRITSRKEMKDYMEHLELYGDGGTDFRPAFEWVDKLLEQHEFHNLKGMIYFTDGFGIYPKKMPPYKTAFVFMQDNYRDVDVPVWAMKLILDEDDFEKPDR